MDTNTALKIGLLEEQALRLERQARQAVRGGDRRAAEQIEGWAADARRLIEELTGETRRAS